MEGENQGYNIDGLDISKPSSVKYEDLKKLRAPFLARADISADHTMKLYSSQANTATAIESTSQGHGAKCVKSLASKINMTLMPPNEPFFRYSSDQVTMLQEGQQELKTALEEGFVDIEAALSQKIEATNDRTKFATSWQRILVTGNVLYHVMDDTTRVFPLHQYVVERDYTGLFTDIIVMEKILKHNLDEELIKNLTPEQLELSPDEPIEIYTRIKLDRSNDKYVVWQEIGDKPIMETKGSYPMDKCPWIPARLFTEENEDYSRSFVEEHTDDFAALVKLEAAQNQILALQVKVVMLVNPTGHTNITDLNNANSGDAIAGSEKDISTVQLQKLGDLNAIENKILKIETRLNQSFLMDQSIQRNAERVTKAEFMHMARSLEQRIGGIYSTQSQEFQRPYIKARYHLLEMANLLPELPKEFTTLTITTGYQALGRGETANKIMTYVTTLAQAFPQTPVEKFVNPTHVSKELAIGMGISVKGLIPTEEEVQAAQQQEQMMQLAQTAAPNLINQMGQQQASQEQPQG